VGLISGETRRGHVRFRRIGNLIGDRDPDWWPSPQSEERRSGKVLVVATVIGVVFVALVMVFVK